MAKKAKKGQSIGRSIALAIFVNLLAFFISAISFFFIAWLLRNVISEQSTINLLAGSAALVLWCISCGLFVLLARYGEPFKKNLKYIGYCFPLTTFFVWAFEQRNLRLKAKEQLARLERIVQGWPDVRIISGIINSEKQRETLGKIIDEIDNMEDHVLAQILENIRRYADEILGSVGANGNYDLFRQVMEKVSLSEPDARPETYTRFLWLLSDVFRMPPEGCFTRDIQKDMVGTLKHTIWRVDRPHLNRIGTIIEQIMVDEEYEHYLARQILEMLLSLDPKKNREVWQIIFDNSIKRAFLFPQYFGLDLHLKLGELKHKVFWLDIQSLMSILEQAVENSEKALICLKPKAYDELCSKIFAPLEDEEHAGKRNCRVFRRLEGEDGRVHVECILPDDKKCNCEGESLSFRGLYSKKCTRKESEKLVVNIIPIVEIGQPKPKYEFTLKASVAKIHPVEANKQSEGRGIFFEDAEEDVVKGLYGYISEHRK
jgi:hypothetical protein